MIRATEVVAEAGAAEDSVTLDYDGRYRRRIALRSDKGCEFLLDLAQTTDLRDGQGLRLEDGRIIGVRAADEDLMIARAHDPHHLVRTAWHVGNRHLPCAIEADRLVLRWDHVIAEMLEGLGCVVERTRGPFVPEGGAYGMGRTHSHAH
ncbi:urease accessory protein UreE [Oceanibium sediminis]|uniref:urease accessory protein UreE n=1 Tax=Oceanibium sediminis TaxID=2026339 RepID=UPI000DD3A953|nr:urease accessory protein UreE [Oceanibium sediminis]